MSVSTLDQCYHSCLTYKLEKSTEDLEQSCRETLTLVPLPEETSGPAWRRSGEPVDGSRPVSSSVIVSPQV